MKFGSYPSIYEKAETDSRRLDSCGKRDTLNSRLNSAFQKLIREHANNEAYPFLKADLLEFFPTIILNNSSPENLPNVKVTKDDKDNVWVAIHPGWIAKI